ncbi:MAG: type II secretion system protein [Tepidisphaeraceae bacterium]
MRASGRAFTLIELLTVIGIIGMLLAILLPTMNRARELALRTRCSSQLHQLAAACAIYLNEHREYPEAPLMPSLAGAAPSGITANLLNELGPVLKWSPGTVDPSMTIDRLPVLATCPFRRRIELFQAADTMSYGIPIWVTGYAYTARLNEAGANVTGLSLQPKAGAQRRGGHRGVIWCDTLAFLQVGGINQGYSNFHGRGTLNFNPSFGTLNDPAPITGQHRAYDDGSVEWVPASKIDLNAAHLDANAAYKLALPGNALNLWYFF